MKSQNLFRLGCALSAAGLAAALLAPSSVPLRAEAAQAPAQAAAPAALPDARAIIDRHVEAIGGRAAVLSYSSSHVRGRVEIPATGMSGPFEMFAAKPNLSLMRMTITGIGDMQEGFNGTVAWVLSFNGPMLSEGRQLEEKKFDSDFYSELRDASRYASITTVERTTFDDRACYKVKFVHKGGNEDVEFYDVETGLRAGAEIRREVPGGMGVVNSTMTLRDYKRFGKLLSPTRQTVRAMGVDQVVSVESIEYDTVDPKVFEPPEPIKALIK